MWFFKRKVKVEPNPWLKIDHPHDWLEANNGDELVCGMCGERKLNKEKKNGKTKKRSKS